MPISSIALNNRQVPVSADFERNRSYAKGKNAGRTRVDRMRALGPDKLLASSQEFGDQIQRGSFNVQTKEMLGPGRAEQGPSLGAFAVSGRIKEEFHAVEVLLFEHAVAAQFL